MGSPVDARIGGHGPSCCAFTVKNIEKRPAKNISSLDSQTMVPTLTMLGLFSECTRWLMEGPARLDEVTVSSMTKGVDVSGTGADECRARVLIPIPMIAHIVVAREEDNTRRQMLCRLTPGVIVRTTIIPVTRLAPGDHRQ